MLRPLCPHTTITAVHGQGRRPVRGHEPRLHCAREAVLPRRGCALPPTLAALSQHSSFAAPLLPHPAHLASPACQASWRGAIPSRPRTAASNLRQRPSQKRWRLTAWILLRVASVSFRAHHGVALPGRPSERSVAATSELPLSSQRRPGDACSKQPCPAVVWLPPPMCLPSADLRR